MRWKNRRRSTNVEDRRGAPGTRSGRGVAVGGGLGGLLILVIALFLGVDPSQLLDAGLTSSAPVATGNSSQNSAQDDAMTEFVQVVLADTEDVWNELFAQAGQRYEEPRLVLFSGSVSSACGMAGAAVGPFYCPGDNQIYIDLSFFRDLSNRFGAPGDFAQAYVVAHEVAHHVQNLLGISGQVSRMRTQASETESNALSVRTELQADCLSGVWTFHAQRISQILERGDLEEALTAASAIGDDRLQRQAGQYVTPDAFTHGSSEQRMRWFRRGLDSGEFDRCDTFSADRL